MNHQSISISGINFPFLYITLPRGKRLIYFNSNSLHDEKNTKNKKIHVNHLLSLLLMPLHKEMSVFVQWWWHWGIMILLPTSLMHPMVQEEIKKRKNIIKCLSSKSAKSWELLAGYLLSVTLVADQRAASRKKKLGKVNASEYKERCTFTNNFNM